MKRYNTPKLIEIGAVVTFTQGALEGSVDGDNLQPFPAGTLGFNL